MASRLSDADILKDTDSAIQTLSSSFPNTWSERTDQQGHGWESWQPCSEVVPHINRLIALAKEHSPKIENMELFAELIFRVGTYLWEREQPTEAQSLFAYGLLLPINTSSQNYAHACRLLGHIALDLAQPKAALSAYQQALEIRQEIEKANSPPIADIYESIACSFTEQGNVLEAFKYLEKAETIHAEHDPLRMARACAISAMIYLRAEQPDEALVALAKCWELQGLTEDQIIGSPYPKHSGDLLLLARIKYSQGLHSEAQQLALKTISLRRDAYGDKSPRVADSMFLVARMQYASDREASTEILREIVEMSRGEKELQAHLDRSLWFLENPEQLPMSKKGKEEPQHQIPWMLW